MLLYINNPSSSRIKTVRTHRSKSNFRCHKFPDLKVEYISSGNMLLACLCLILFPGKKKKTCLKFNNPLSCDFCICLLHTLTHHSLKIFFLRLTSSDLPISSISPLYFFFFKSKDILKVKLPFCLLNSLFCLLSLYTVTFIHCSVL